MHIYIYYIHYSIHFDTTDPDPYYYNCTLLVTFFSQQRGDRRSIHDYRRSNLVCYNKKFHRVGIVLLAVGTTRRSTVQSVVALLLLNSSCSTHT